MDVQLPGTIRITSDPAVKIFDNGSAVLVRPEVPDWIRTSEVGILILDLVRAAPRTAEEAILEVMARYQLPDQAVRTPVLRFLEALIAQGYAQAEPEPRNGDRAVAGRQDGPPSRPLPPRLEGLKMRQLWLHITSQCNLRCEYCYYRVEHPGRELSLDTARALFEQAAALEVNQMILSGGEPMLHSRILDLVRACREASQWHVKLVSNGTMPDGDVFDRVVELINDLQISIDGTDEATHDAVRGKGSFSRAIRAFKRLHDTDSSTCRGIAFTPMTHNIDQIPELNKLGYQLAADYLHLNHPKRPADPDRRMRLEASGFLGPDFQQRAVANFRRLFVNMLSDRKDAHGMRYRPLHLDASFANTSSLINILHLDNCGAGITTLGFDPDGTAYPCAALTGRQECRLGQFPEQSLNELLQAGRAWNRTIFSVDRDPVCGQCIYRYFCGGGCRATGESLSDRDRNCSVLRQCYDEFFKYASLPENESLVPKDSGESQKRWNHAETHGCTET